MKFLFLLFFSLCCIGRAAGGAALESEIRRTQKLLVKPGLSPRLRQQYQLRLGRLLIRSGEEPAAIDYLAMAERGPSMQLAFSAALDNYALLRLCWCGEEAEKRLSKLPELVKKAPPRELSAIAAELAFPVAELNSLHRSGEVLTLYNVILRRGLPRKIHERLLLDKIALLIRRGELQSALTELDRIAAARKGRFFRETLTAAADITQFLENFDTVMGIENLSTALVSKASFASNLLLIERAIASSVPGSEWEFQALFLKYLIFVSHRPKEAEKVFENYPWDQFPVRRKLIYWRSRFRRTCRSGKMPDAESEAIYREALAVAVSPADRAELLALHIVQVAGQPWRHDQALRDFEQLRHFGPVPETAPAIAAIAGIFELRREPEKIRRLQQYYRYFLHDLPENSIVSRQIEALCAVAEGLPGKGFEILAKLLPDSGTEREKLLAMFGTVFQRRHQFSYAQWCLLQLARSAENAEKRFSAGCAAVRTAVLAGNTVKALEICDWMAQRSRNVKSHLHALAGLRIRVLIEAGKLAEAESEIAGFAKAYGNSGETERFRKLLRWKTDQLSRLETD